MQYMTNEEISRREFKESSQGKCRLGRPRTRWIGVVNGGNKIK